MKNFEPKCMATCLSVVPHRSPIEACRIMLEDFPEAPCIPRLSMSVRMFMDGLPCIIIDAGKRHITFDLSREHELLQFYENYFSQELDYFAMSVKYASGFYTLLDILKESRPPRLKLIHTQMPGVVTWGLSLTDQNGVPAWYNETMRDVLTKTLIMKAKWQEKKLKEAIPDIETMVTLGEPSLSVVSSPFGSITVENTINSLNEVLQNIEGLSCVHCCANIDWQMLMRTNTQVIYFDAYKFSEKIALYPEDVWKFLNRGGILAWGIVPVNEETVSSEGIDSLLDKLEKGVELLVKRGVNKQILLERSFITPSCVTSTLSLKSAEKVLGLTKSISEIMRKRYFED